MTGTVNLFPFNLNVSPDLVSENIEILGNKIHCFPGDQLLSVNCVPYLSACFTSLFTVKTPFAGSASVFSLESAHAVLHGLQFLSSQRTQLPGCESNNFIDMLKHIKEKNDITFFELYKISSR